MLFSLSRLYIYRDLCENTDVNVRNDICIEVVFTKGIGICVSFLTFCCSRQLVGILTISQRLLVRFSSSQSPGYTFIVKTCDGWMNLTWNTSCPYGFSDPKICTSPKNLSIEIHYQETENFPFRFSDQKSIQVPNILKKILLICKYFSWNSAHAQNRTFDKITIANCLEPLSPLLR